MQQNVLVFNDEWRRFGALPAVAALGYATSVIHIYGLGPYIEPLQEAFGWSRAQATSGLTIATIINAIFCVGIGLLVDRIGPRLVGLIGVVLTCGAFSLLSFANGDTGQWLLLWGILAFATLPVQATVWTGAVASRFTDSRGMALAITLSGASLAAALFPFAATWLIDEYGWRQAFMLEAGIWFAFTFPFLLFFFRGARDDATTLQTVASDESPGTQELEGVEIMEGFTSWVFVRLFFSSIIFTFCIIALVVHFVPILTAAGTDRLTAAGITSLVGLASVLGRLGTGFLLDRFNAARVGATIFLLPIIACLLLIFGGPQSYSQSFAAFIIGLTLGSEIDVIVYLTTRHFGMKNFGAIYGGLLTALSIGTATGPLAAATVFDQFGSYEPFLTGTIVLMLFSSWALVGLTPPDTALKNAK